MTWGVTMTTLAAIATHNIGSAALLSVLKILTPKASFRIRDISSYGEPLISDAHESAR